MDYDPTAEKIAEAGYALAKDMNAELTLLHVLAETQYYMPLDYSPIMGFSGMPLDIAEPVHAEDLKVAALSFLEATKIHLGDPSIKTMVAEGEFAFAILKVAKEINAGIIVAGTHSRNALEKILMGSVTEKLLHDSDVPLYLVPTRTK